jgi:hypothetical protein
VDSVASGLLPNGNNSACELSTLNSPLSTIISPLQGFGKMGKFLIRRLRFASPPVMHFTPLAGLRAKNKNSTDILRIFKYSESIVMETGIFDCSHLLVVTNYFIGLFILLNYFI